MITPTARTATTRDDVEVARVPRVVLLAILGLPASATVGGLVLALPLTVIATLTVPGPRRDDLG